MKVPGSPFTSGIYEMELLRTDASGRFLYGVSYNVTATDGHSAVELIALDPLTGGMSPVAGSPYVEGTGYLQQLAVGGSWKSAAASIVSVSLPSTTVGHVGIPYQFQLQANLSDGTTQYLNGSATWSSSTPSVASISSTGLATVLNSGQTTIRGCYGATLCAQSVMTAYRLSSVIVTPANPTIPPGPVFQMYASGLWGDGTNTDLATYVTWSSSNQGVATVQPTTGGVFPSNPGTTNITATTNAAIGSLSGFTVLTVQGPDLTVNKSHPSQFFQGQTGASYLITATNSGALATSGAVSVIDSLPSALTATAMSGNGWTCTLATLTCTRSDALGAGMSYPVISLTVNVAPNAPASVTNTVVVSGGGEGNTANDSWADPTNIAPAVDFIIAKSHAGNFTQGQTGASYSLLVTNVGGVASSGVVTVADTLPAGLTATAMSGNRWNCTMGTLTCSRADALPGGGSYPPITVTVAVAANAPSSVTNIATVAGGGETNTANDTALDPTTILPAPDLTITKSHSGNFTQGQTGVSYTITVTNSGAGPTSGSVSVVDSIPSGLTATTIGGQGWNCTLATATCTRSDSLAAGSSYAAITVIVSVAANAPASVTNVATVSGGGEINTSNNTASDPTTINAAVPDLTITKSHSGNFIQGLNGATYTITVTNSGAAATNGTVSVVDTLPTGLTATTIVGSGWNCTLGTLACTRSDALAAGSSYAAITLIVNVAANAPASVTNVATVSGGGEINTSNDTASDPTAISAGTVQVTITTNPPGLAIAVDGVNYAAPQTLTWQVGATHTIATTSIQAGATGVRYVWSNWSDGGPISHTDAVTVPGPFTITANFGTEFLLTTSASPANGGQITPVSGYYAQGAVVPVSATANSNFVFANFTGALTGSTNPQSITMNAPASVTAVFTATTVQVTVATNPPALAILVDGVNYTAPQTFTWQVGATHTLATTSIQQGATGVRYVWSNWSDGGPISHTDAITVPGTFTVTANFGTEFLLTTATSPATGGQITPATGYYPQGAVVPVSATPNPNFVFANFTGALTGATNPQSLTMNAPAAVTAVFSASLPSLFAASGGVRTDGTVAGTRNVPLALTNGGVAPAGNATITSISGIAVLGGSGSVSVASGLPANLGTIAPGASAIGNIVFNWPVTATRITFTVNYTADGGYSGSNSITLFR